MKNKIQNIIGCAVVALSSAIFISAMPGEGAITNIGDTTIINTTTLGNNIHGFKGSTPIKIYIRKNKVVKIETLQNKETPKFFNRAKTLLTAFEGLTVNKALDTNVDGVSGATYSSKALKQNVKLGLEYYKKTDGTTGATRKNR